MRSETLRNSQRCQRPLRKFRDAQFREISAVIRIERPCRMPVFLRQATTPPSCLAAGGQLVGGHDPRAEGAAAVKTLAHIEEFLTQGIEISKLSRTIVSVNAMAPYQTEAACSRQVAEIVIQLNNRFPGLTEKITEAGGTVFHVLSRNRANCSWKTTAGSMSLTVPCSSNFTVYCSGGRSLFLEASDTGYRAQAREEAKEYALKSGRKQLD
jgi:hypothetical protein